MDLPPDLPQPFWRAEALAAGVTRHELAGLTRRGRLRRLHRCLFAAMPAWGHLAPWARHPALAHAAARAVPGTVASHVSAALLWGLPSPRRLPSLVHLTLLGPSTDGADLGAEAPGVGRDGGGRTREGTGGRQGGRTSRTPDWYRLHRGELGPAHVVAQGGIHLTTPGRTVADCLRQLHLADGVAVADAALRQGLVSLGGLAALRREQRRWQGVTRTDAALPLLDPRRENWLESASAAVLGEWGLPLAVPQVEVLDERGDFLGRVDAYWEEAGVVGEADGRGKYLEDDNGSSLPARAVAERLVASAARESRLRDIGLEVIRWDPSEVVRTPELVARRYHAARRRGDPARVRGLVRCACCRLPLTHCAVDREIAAFRAELAA